MTATATLINFRDINIIYNGVIVDGFYQGDDVVHIDPAEELITPIVGADGKGVWNQSNNFAAKISFKLLKSSSMNNILAADYLLAKHLKPEARLVTINSTNGNFVAGGMFLVANFPSDLTLGSKDNGVTWVLSTLYLDISPGAIGLIFQA